MHVPSEQPCKVVLAGKVISESSLPRKRHPTDAMNGLICIDVFVS